jgi:DNA-binding SARP family transcriptional activator
MPMAVEVHLLGRPCALVEGRPVRGPRGRKSWAVLALLVLGERPPSRRRLAELLFAEADDPLGALRWTLAELRRVLDIDLGGDPVEIRWGMGDRVDVPLGDAVPDSDQLLDGISLPDSPLFESWLLVQRRRQGAAVHALLRETAMAELASGRNERAVELAARLVGLAPLEEAGHTLLVRALAVSGDRTAAAQAAAQCAVLFEHELGTPPSTAVRVAVDAGIRYPSAPVLHGSAAARAQLKAGDAALAAGATEAGLDCLRRAVTEARGCGDEQLLAASLTALGSALVHAVRGRDEEGSAVFHESLQLSQSATALRELGFVDVQAGRRARATRWLERARAAASGDDREIAAIDGVRGMNLSDSGHYEQALPVLTASVERALRCGSRRQAAWSASLIGRLHLLRGSLEDAARALATSLDLVEQERWLAFQPWPEAFAAELDIASGSPHTAERRLTEAFALSCQLADPCWEAVTARGLAVLRARQDPAGALALLDDARGRCVRWPDTYQWVLAYTLDAACTAAVTAGDPSASERANELAAIAARTDMREFLHRASAHQRALGEPKQSQPSNTR